MRHHRWLQIHGPGTPLVRVLFLSSQYHGAPLVGGKVRPSTRYWRRRARWNRHIKRRQIRWLLKHGPIHLPINLTPYVTPFPVCAAKGATP